MAHGLILLISCSLVLLTCCLLCCITTVQLHQLGQLFAQFLPAWV
jgi:hypothetical protein